MADIHGEALCGLMDGELGESETRFLIRRLGQDRELTARWGRYHLARSVVREHVRVNLNGFADRVGEALEADSAPARSVHWMTWLKPVGGAALAASVALVAFNVWRGSTPEPADAQMLSASGSAPRAMSLATRASQTGAWNPRLQSYLIRHNEATALGRSQGLAPYRYLVSVPAPKAAYEEPPEPLQDPAED